MNRRDFIRLGGLSAASAAASGAVNVLESRAQEARRTLRVGLIGAGWYGNVDLYHLTQVCQDGTAACDIDVVAICDVDRDSLEKTAKKVAARQNGREPRQFSDYREALKESNLDVVLIGTPDHWHALVAIAAIEAGCDVYLQKPIGVDVRECQAILAAARAKGAVVQIGLQRRSAPHLIEAKREIIDSGRLGRVGQVDIYSYYGGPGPAFNQEPTEVPEAFDFDFWCGPAPKLPYYPCLRRGTWRRFMEYGNGTLGDMGVHMFDMARWLLDLRYPRRIFSVAGQYIKRGGISNCSDTQTVVFDYGDLEVVWNHRTWSELPDPRHPWGGYFYGEKGLLKASVFGYDFRRYHSKETQSVDVAVDNPAYPGDKTEEGLERQCCESIREHMRDFVARIVDRGRPRSDVEEGAISTICCVLGNISAKLGRALEWDEEAGRVRNDDEANALLAREYRAPWIHP